MVLNIIILVTSYCHCLELVCDISLYITLFEIAPLKMVANWQVMIL